MGSQRTPPTTTQETTQRLGPEQQQVFNAAFPYIKQYANKPIQQYAGTGIAPFSQDELLAQEKARRAAGSAEKLASEAASTNSMLMDPKFMLDVANNKYLNDANAVMTRDVTRNLQENILPGVQTGSVQSGGMYSGGSTRTGIAQGQAIGRTNQALSDAIAKQHFDAYNRGLTGMEGAVGRNAGVQAQQLIPSEILGGVGAQQRAMEQAQKDEEIRKFYTGQELPLLQAQELMRLIGGMPGGTNVSTATGSTPSVPWWMAGAGGAATGAALGSALGPWGTAGGAGLGLLASLLMNR